MSVRLAVTTGRKPRSEDLSRARQLAQQFGVRYLRRRGLEQMIGPNPRPELLYVVTRRREELASLDETLFVHEGLLKSKLTHGDGHPLVRAVRGDEPDPPGRIFEATLGLCGDALHLAGAFPCARVEGTERSPVLAALAEEGLSRLRRSEGHPAGRVHARCADALAYLEEGRRFDVVYVDPMFSEPARAAPGFNLMRGVASPSGLDPEALQVLARHADRRVVMKVRAVDETPPPGLDWQRRLEGKATAYWVFETGA